MKARTTFSTEPIFLFTIECLTRPVISADRFTFSSMVRIKPKNETEKNEPLFFERNKLKLENLSMPRALSLLVHLYTN
jgi:hypothetical protein